MPKVPIPNQPLFTFDYTATPIGMTVNVVNSDNKVAVLHMYCTVGRVSRAVITIPVIRSGFTHRGRIYVHGYFITPNAPFSSTRFRIPLIVSIWRLYLGYCNVIANMTETMDRARVIANNTVETENIKPTWVLVDTRESDESIKGAFSVSSFIAHRHTMNTVTDEKTQVSKMMIESGSRDAVQHQKLVANILPIEHNRTIRFKVFSIEVLISKANKLFARVASNTLDRVHKMKVYVAGSMLGSVHKMIAKVVPSYITSMFKLKSSLNEQENNAKHKLSVSLIKKTQEVFAKGITRLHRSTLYSMHRMKVNIVRKEIEELLGRIQWLISRRLLTNKTTAKLMPFKIEQKTAVKATARSSLTSRIKVGINMLATKARRLLHIQSMEDMSKRLLQVHTHKIEDKSAIHVKSSSNQHISDNHHVRVLSESTDRNFKLKFEYLTRNENLGVSIDVLPILAERSILIKPANIPQVKWLNVLVTVLNTETLVFVHAAIAELEQDLNVRISTFEHETISLLQWYLHGGNMHTEGYGNEVIFDLGQPDDGSDGPGTIPPIPSRHWTGGYVEDPFKGVGYKPEPGSTGYVSPSVNKWLAGSKMYWSSATEPFQEE